MTPPPHLNDQLRACLRPAIDKIGQAEAARVSKIPRPQINQWLSGKRGMSIDRIDHLARSLGLKIEATVSNPHPL